MDEGANVHATCVVVDEGAILIRGPSGSGKSTLARELVRTARANGRFARLVSDDRTLLYARNGRLIAKAVAAIAGKIEVRGVGIVEELFEPTARVRLVVDLSATEPPRLPQREDGVALLCGVAVPRLRQRDGASVAAVVLDNSGFCDTVMTE